MRQIFDRVRELDAQAANSARARNDYPGADFTGERDISFSIGFTVRELTPQLADILKAQGGILISSVATGSLAERSGFKAGDVIVRTQNATITKAEELKAFLSNNHGTMQLTLVRNKQELALNVTLP